jgi:hypothetical protein
MLCVYLLTLKILARQLVYVMVTVSNGYLL